jgi:hypothetical protein
MVLLYIPLLLIASSHAMDTIHVFLDIAQTTTDTGDDGPSHPISAFTLAEKNSTTNNATLIVQATYIDSIPTIGQGRLTVSTVSVDNNAASDKDYFYALGLAEGYLTAERIVQQMYNVVWSKPRQNEYIYEFLSAQYNYMRTQSVAHWRDDPYWFQVGLSLARLDGIMDGLKSKQAEMIKITKNLRDEFLWPYYPVTYMALYELNSNSELGEIAGSVAADRESVNTGRFTDQSGVGLSPPPSELSNADLRIPEHLYAEKTKCSSLVKLVHPNNLDKIDIIVSHNTWTSYGEMLRIYKSFSFPHVSLHPSFVNKKFSMASYPGYLSSTDDWVTAYDSQILVTETTNECLSRKRLREYVQPNSVTTVVRSIVASVMSNSGSEWFDVFSRENSGTYNNQWIIVDFKPFTNWKFEWKKTGDKPVEFPDNVLWIIEQAPGLVVGHDKSIHLFSESYWASYNRPYYSLIANVSGYTAASKLHGEWFEHAKCPRARIFSALHSAVENIESMRSIMSLNMWDVMNATYLHTHNCPKNQLAGRYDIDPQLPINSIEYRKCGPVMAYGALDLKVTNSHFMKQDAVIMVSAPLWNNSVGPFNWSELPIEAQIAHWGQPEKWDFPAYIFRGNCSLFDPDPLPEPRHVRLPKFVLDNAVALPEEAEIDLHF